VNAFSFTRKLIVLLLVILNYSIGFAQFTDTLAQIAKVVFYEKTVYKKIFMEHKDYVDGSSVLLLPNLPMTRKYPRLTDKIEINDKIGNQNYTTLYLNEKGGPIILTLPRYDTTHVLFVGFHRFSYTPTEANVEFHTTSKTKVDSLSDRYIKVICSLKNKNGEWKIVKLKMEKNDCCKDYPYYAWDIISEYYYK
jgi:hypothetical protein